MIDSKSPSTLRSRTTFWDRNARPMTSLLRHRYKPLLPEEEARESEVVQAGPPASQAPKKEILLGLFLLCLGISFFTLCYLHWHGHTRQHIQDGAGWGLAVLGILTFLPGAYSTWVAVAVWMGLPGYRYTDIPRVE